MHFSTKNRYNHSIITILVVSNNCFESNMIVFDVYTRLSAWVERQNADFDQNMQITYHTTQPTQHNVPSF